MIVRRCTLLPGLFDFRSHLGIDARRSTLGLQVQAEIARYGAAGITRIQDLRAGVTTMRLYGDRHGADLADLAVRRGRIIAVAPPGVEA